MTRDEQNEKKLTVAHFMPWSGVGGVEIATLRMTEATRRRFRNVAFCLDDATSLRNSFENIGIETITYIPPEPSLRHGAKFYKESLAVANLLRKVRADIVHFSEIKAAYHNSLAARMVKSRMICHVRNTYPNLSLRDRLGLLPVHSLIFVSQEARRRFSYSLSDTKARVIFDAIDIPGVSIAECNESVRHELGIPLNSPVVGMVARVNPQKDYYTLASAASVVIRKYPATRFLIVGDNSLVDMNRSHYGEIANKLRELEIFDNFIFTGHRNDVPRLIAAMDISVLSTHREGFGLCIAESMAMRKPVVATAVGGLLDFVQHGVTGYLHQHENSEELATEIISLIANPDEAHDLGESGYRYVKENYSRDAFVNAISKTYADVLLAQ